MDFLIENGCLTQYTGPDCHVTLPETVTRIGERAFAGTGITGVTFSSGLTSIGHHAFANCKQLTAVTIPASVRETGQYVFAGCDALERIDFEEGTEKICFLSFSHCKAVRELRIRQPSAAGMADISVLPLLRAGSGKERKSK